MEVTGSENLVVFQNRLCGTSMNQIWKEAEMQVLSHCRWAGSKAEPLSASWLWLVIKGLWYSVSIWPWYACRGFKSYIFTDSCIQIFSTISHFQNWDSIFILPLTDRPAIKTNVYNPVFLQMCHWNVTYSGSDFLCGWGGVRDEHCPVMTGWID